MPVTQWLDDTVQRLDASTWRLTVAGAVYTLADLRALPQETVDATLDCTSQWYARQSWRGVRLDRLLDPGDARSILVRSVTGYPVRLPVRDLGRVWLALEVGGAPLSPGHGFPVRLVAPGRRGFWWVKWVQDVERSPLPWWVQSPFPLT
jgi:DMSO/TMAO reductase YedYZ molybdopterin-dependent catalytic subunit